MHWAGDGYLEHIGVLTQQLIIVTTHTAACTQMCVTVLQSHMPGHARTHTRAQHGCPRGRPPVPLPLPLCFISCSDACNNQSTVPGPPTSTHTSHTQHLPHSPPHTHTSHTQLAVCRPSASGLRWQLCGGGGCRGGGEGWRCVGVGITCSVGVCVCVSSGHPPPRGPSGPPIGRASRRDSVWPAGVALV